MHLSAFLRAAFTAQRLVLHSLLCSSIATTSDDHCLGWEQLPLQLCLTHEILWVIALT